MKLSVFAKRVLLYLVIGFVIILIWWNPDATAVAVRQFLETIGSTFMALYDRAVTFLKGLSGQSSSTGT